MSWFICNYFIFKKELPSNVSFRDGLTKSIQSDLLFLLKKSGIGLKFMNVIGKPLWWFSVVNQTDFFLCRIEPSPSQDKWRLDAAESRGSRPVAWVVLWGEVLAVRSARNLNRVDLVAFDPQAYLSILRTWNEGPTQRFCLKIILRWLIVLFQL